MVRNPIAFLTSRNHGTMHGFRGGGLTMLSVEDTRPTDPLWVLCHHLNPNKAPFTACNSMPERSVSFYFCQEWTFQIMKGVPVARLCATGDWESPKAFCETLGGNQLVINCIKSLYAVQHMTGCR